MSQITQEKENKVEVSEEKSSKQIDEIKLAKEDENKAIEKSTDTNVEKEIPVVDKKNSEAEKVTETKINEEKKVSKFTKKKKIIFFISIIFILFICLFSTFFAILNNSNDNILKNYFVSGIDISNLSKEDAIKKIQTELENRKNRTYNLYSSEQTTTVTEEELDIAYNIEETVNAVYSKGRSGNILKDNYTILFSKFSSVNVDLEPYFLNEEEKVNYLISDLQNVLPGKVVEFNYEIDDDELIVTPGTSGLKIISQELKNNILQKAKYYNEDNIIVTYETINPQKITAEELQKEIYVEPKDAYYETSPKFVIYPHVVGVDFAISLEEVQEILNEEKEEYIIPLKLTKPSKLTTDIGSENFPDLLGKFSTNYNASNTSRSTNLRIACNKINGTIVLPGETFSYNKVVGKRTVEAGYQNAAIYEGGKVVDGLAGGICQVSSTLYNAVLYSNLEIVERRNHGFRTSYIAAGRDATVVYGATDFKFKNTRNYPIKIKASCSGGVCKFEIYGIHEDVEYDVSISVTTLSTTPFNTEYQDTTDLAEGVTKVEQGGMNGAKTKTYRTLKLNGNVVKTELLSTDTYKPMTKIILRGVAATSTPDVPETPITTTPSTQIENDTPQPPSTNIENPTIDSETNDTTSSNDSTDETNTPSVPNTPTIDTSNSDPIDDNSDITPEDTITESTNNS